MLRFTTSLGRTGPRDNQSVEYRSMLLVRMIADFSLVQTRLAASFRRETAVSTRVALMRRATTLMDAIERHDPVNRAEMQIKVEFFLCRARRSPTGSDGRRDLAIAMDLISRFDAAGQAQHPNNSRSTLPWEVLDRLAGRGAREDQLADYIRNLPQRSSILDSGYRHICTSRGNAAFHGRAPAEFNGMHMGDLIGSERFNTRCKQQMTNAMNGRRLSYYYPLEVPVLGMRVIQCKMQPWTHLSGETGGVMILANDVTDRLTGAHGFGNVPVVANGPGAGWG